jgi:hypothetical protein
MPQQRVGNRDNAALCPRRTDQALRGVAVAHSRQCDGLLVGGSSRK